ncbi:HER020Cp [Eremothecium sinecaudum]|uniref:HER020Cp n=1 Tax=Eremothecium sinecaudum TaxID=45286 RepID=A0A0X8HTP8_9SACH|nr:HER020Cp [Eremothecium sinecaudum]AMD21299.1 HER020Cp [Eremothecium sinecaudum]
MSYRRNILEFHAREKLSLPIVKFPKFQLRSLLIEKDPVIWLRHLETYVAYIQYLLGEGRVDNLDSTTTDQLIIFIRSFLSEMADEEDKLLSLGINMNVNEQLRLLKAWVFVLIKSCGLLHLQLFSDTLWNMVKLYVREYPETVRALIVGTLKPVINTQKANLNNVYQIQQHFKNLIDSSKFSRVDLKALEALLSKDSRAHFADEFLSKNWTEIIETLYSTGPHGFSALWGKKLGILSYLSASEERLISLLSELGIAEPAMLTTFPLLGSLLLNDNFKKRRPGLYERVPLLRALRNTDSISKVETQTVSDGDMDVIRNIFPHITDYQIEFLLGQYENNCELTINALLEDSTIVDKIPVENEETKLNGRSLKSENSKIELKVRDKVIRKRPESVTNIPDEVRNRTMIRTLELLYSEYEDERDDTYDDAEVTRTSTDRVPIEGPANEEISAYEKVESYLWDILRIDKTLFDRKLRGTSKRKEMKKVTLWSDEQIEGWARMLERSPRRAQLLEEKYMFWGNIRKGKTSYVKNVDGEELPERSINTNSRNHSRNVLPSSPDGKPSKKQHANNERNKKSRANHNRKIGHDKKIGRSGPS